MLDPNSKYDLVVGLDRSDRKIDLHFIDTTNGQTRSETLASSPEKLRQWLLDLRQRYPKANVAICLEQPAGHLRGSLLRARSVFFVSFCQELFYTCSAARQGSL
jgi:hypothetical protein